MLVQSKKLFEQEKKLTEQTCLIAELQKKQTDQDEQISNLNRKVTEYDQKFADIAIRIDRICAVSSTDKMTALSVEPHGPLLQSNIEYGHLPCAKDAEKQSVGNKYTKRQRQKRLRQSDKAGVGDMEKECDMFADSRCISQKRAKISIK